LIAWQSMDGQLQHEHSAERDEAIWPVEFIAICAVAFIAGVATTAYLCRSMSATMCVTL
jgi:hypothetical protein